MIGYRLVRALARLLLSLFYRRIEAPGMDRVPATGPLVVAAHHRNALVDPMLLLATVPRPLRPLAKAPLFRYPLIGTLLRLAGAIPVHRRQDPGSDPARNVEMFRAATTALAEGGAILIFPEGVSQGEPTLMPLKTGAARIVLATAAARGGATDVTLLPVGLVFHEPGTFRTGWALALAGAPVRLDDCVADYTAAPAEAVRRLTDRLAAAVRDLGIEAGDRKILRLLTVARDIWRQEGDRSADDPASEAAWMMRATRVFRYLAPREPRRVEALMQAVERYAMDLDRAGFTGDELRDTYSPGAVRRFAVREGLALLLGLPLTLWGLVNHGVPYRLTALVARLARPAADVEATYKLIAGLVLYPLSWAVEGWLVWRLGGPWLTALIVASLAPTGFFALTWWERIGRVRREARSFVQFLAHGDLRRHLATRRRDLMTELIALARLVPESAMAGERPVD